MEVTSKQATHGQTVSTKLEWVIDNFGKLMRLFKNGHSLISKQFGAPKFGSVIWELHIYPNGKRETEDAGFVSFFLRQIGLKENEEPIMTDFKIYARDGSGNQVSVCRDVKDFTHQQGRGKFQVPREKLSSALHPDGSLHLECDVEFFPPGTKLEAEAQNEPKKVAVDVDLRPLLDKELLTDCCIKVGNKLLKAHRCILALHSEVFRSMFQQEGMVEAQNGIIDITDSHPEPVMSMLEFMYTATVDGVEKCPEEILALAEKYAVHKLKEVCENRLARGLSRKNLCDTVLFADTYNATNLKSACVAFLSQHHRDIIKAPEWKRLKKDQPLLANELLEQVLCGETNNYGTLNPDGECSSQSVDSVRSGLHFSPSPVKAETSPKQPPRKRQRRSTYK